MSRIAILGGGSWGTGLAVVLAHSRRKHDIRVWVRDISTAQSIQESRENSTYLPGIAIPECVYLSNGLEEVLRTRRL